MKGKGMKYGVLMIIIMALASCEGGTTFTKTIENKSSEDLTVKLYTSQGSTDAILIKSNEQKQVYWDDQMGRFVDNSYTCTQVLDSVHIDVSNNKRLIKDILNSDNWERDSKDGRNSKEKCTFTITDSDLQ